MLSAIFFMTVIRSATMPVAPSCASAIPEIEAKAAKTIVRYVGMAATGDGVDPVKSLPASR